MPAAKPLAGLDVGPIKWRNIKTDFGAVGNGVSSDFVAFRAFRNWALAQNGWVGLVVPPSSGHYITGGQYGGGANNTPFFGIKKLIIAGYGASMDGLHGAALVNRAEYRHKIRTVYAGSSTVELIDRASVRFLSVGSMVLLAGLDLQGGWGYPPNSHFNEWHRIKSLNGWRVTFDRPIKYDYKDNWPRYFEGHQNELGGIGPAAICRTVPEWDCEHRIYGLRSISKGQTYYFIRKAILVDVRHDAQGWITGASQDHQIIGQDHTASLMEVDKLTTMALIAEYGPANRSITIQSSSVDEMHIRGGTRSINGTARHTLIEGGASEYVRLGPIAYGISERIEMRGRNISSAVYGAPGMGVALSELSFKNGTFRFAGYKHPPQWFVPGAIGIIRTESPYFDHHIFRILSVRSENGAINGPILIDTDIKGDILPSVIGYKNVSIVRHNAPNLTVINCSGCPDAEELSLAPPNSPYGIISRRTHTGFPYQPAGVPTSYLCGRLVSLKINVVQAYTGSAPSLIFRLGQFGYGVIRSDKTVLGSRIGVNCKIAGERVIRAEVVLGERKGDVGLSDLTGGIWLPKALGAFFGADNTGGSPVNISGEDASVRPIIIVEALTDQEFRSA